MRNFFKNEYRVVHRWLCGWVYIPQVKYWWCPFWIDLHISSGETEAEEICRRHASRVVKKLGKLP